MRRFQEWAWRCIPGVHPGIECLIMRADGEQFPELEAHLTRCARCSKNAESLLAAVRAAHEGERSANNSTTPLLNEIFGSLQLQMRAWCSLGALMPRQSPERAGRDSGSSKAVEFYFGKEIARRIESCTRWEAAGHPLTAITNPLFKAFLGTRAADALARQIASPTM